MHIHFGFLVDEFVYVSPLAMINDVFLEVKVLLGTTKEFLPFISSQEGKEPRMHSDTEYREGTVVASLEIFFDPQQCLCLTKKPRMKPGAIQSTTKRVNGISKLGWGRL